MSKNNNKCDLKSCFLCNFCLEDWMPAIAAQKKSYWVKKGEAIFKEGDVVTGMYFVYTAAVKVHKRWGKEKELILRFANSGDILGHMGLGADNYYPVSATAVKAGVVCYVDMDFFRSSLNVNSSLAYNLITFLTDELKESEHRMRNLAHMPVKGRVAQALITLRKQFGTNAKNAINIELSRQDLASYTGTAYETLFRVLVDLTDDKTISITGRDIFILNEEKLLALTAEVV